MVVNVGSLSKFTGTQPQTRGCGYFPFRGVGSNKQRFFKKGHRAQTAGSALGSKVHIKNMHSFENTCLFDDKKVALSFNSTN